MFIGLYFFGGSIYLFAENVKLQTHLQHIRENLDDSAVRRKLTFNFIGLMVYVLAIAYLTWRGWAASNTQLPLSLFVFIVSLIAILAPSFAFTFDQGQAKKTGIKVAAYIGFYWVAYFIYAMILMLTVDVARLVNNLSDGRLMQLIPASLQPDFRMAVSIVLPTSLILLLIGTFFARSPKVRTYKVSLNKPFAADRPLRIAFLSDLHIGSLVSTANIKVLADRVNKQKPDIILLGGDLIDNSLHLISRHDFLDQMRKLKAPMGVYAVLGNHELVNTTAQEMNQFLELAGIRLLQDEQIEFDDFVLVGRNEHQTQYSKQMERLTPEALLETINHEKPIVVMQHQPTDLACLAELGSDVALAGHTHRGQLFPLHLLQKRQYAQVARYRKHSAMHSIISDGYGTWGPPVRIGSRSEIVMLELSGQDMA